MAKPNPATAKPHIVARHPNASTIAPAATCPLKPPINPMNMPAPDSIAKRDGGKCNAVILSTETQAKAAPPPIKMRPR